jgi:hypothetical protein
MTLTIVWHKPCWFDSQSPTGFASRGCLGHPGFGGLPREVEVLSELFDSTRIVGPCYATGDPTGEIAITGKNISMIALTWLHRSPWLTWVVLPFWFCRNGLRLIQEISKSDAVYVFIPSPIGLLGLIRTCLQCSSNATADHRFDSRSDLLELRVDCHRRWLD